MLSSKRRSYLKQEMVIIDPASRLRAIINYGFNAKAVDRYEGIITSFDKTVEEVQQIMKSNRKPDIKKQKSLKQMFCADISKKVKKMNLENYDKAMRKDKSNTLKKLGEVKGSWLEELLIDGEQRWNCDIQRWRYQVMKDPLPSDFRYREDILWIREKNIPMAQKWKLALELRIRTERKTRDKLNKKRKKAKK